MKIKIIDADRMGVDLTYSNGDIVEVEYDVDREEYRDTEEPFTYHVEWEGKYFEFVEKQFSEWSGEYLPPVGEIVRHIETGNSVEIACYFHGRVVYWDFEIGGFHSGTADDFEPIKSKKDKEVEEIVSLYEDAMPVEAFAKKLYEHGYRKTK